MKTSTRSLPKPQASRAPITVAPVMEPELQDYAGDLDAVQLNTMVEKLDRWGNQLRAQAAFLAGRQMQGN